MSLCMWGRSSFFTHGKLRRMWWHFSGRNWNETTPLGGYVRGVEIAFPGSFSTVGTWQPFFLPTKQLLLTISVMPLLRSRNYRGKRFPYTVYQGACWNVIKILGKFRMWKRSNWEPGHFVSWTELSEVCESVCRCMYVYVVVWFTVGPPLNPWMSSRC